MGLYLKTFALGTTLFLLGWAGSTWSHFRVDGGTLEVFLGLFGAFYAIIIGFIIFIAMDNYNRVREKISAEVNALQDLRDYLIFVDHDPEQNSNDQVVIDIRQKLRAYVEQVVKVEWKLMTRGRPVSAKDRDTPPALTELMRTVNRIHVANRSDDVALELLVATLGNITTHRTNRLAACGTRLSPALRNLVLWMTLLASAVFWFLAVPAEAGLAPPETVTWVLSAVNAYSVTFIYFIVLDLDDPFRGTWRIDRSDFDDLLKRLAA